MANFVVLTDSMSRRVRVNMDRVAEYVRYESSIGGDLNSKHSGTMLYEHLCEPTSTPSCEWVRETPEEIDAMLYPSPEKVRVNNG